MNSNIACSSHSYRGGLRAGLLNGVVVLMTTLLLGPALVSHGVTIPILEYQMGEDDSPNPIGGPATNPSLASVGSENLVRAGTPDYVAGNPSIGSSRAIRISNLPGVAPQYYSTEFDFNPTENSRWGFSCWVKFNALPDPDKSPEVPLMHVGDINAGGIVLQTFAKDGGIKFGTHAPGIAINVGNTEVQLGKWTHLAVVFDGPGKLYVDGVEDGNVGGGQNPPTGVTVGATRFTQGSFGASANVTFDMVRLFEVEAGTFTVDDLLVPPQQGPTIVSAVGDAFGFAIEIQDNGNSVLKPDSLVLKLNGDVITPTSVSKPGNTLIEFTRPAGSPFPANVYGIDITFSDTAGQSYSDARSFRVRSYSLLPADYQTVGVDTTQLGFSVRPHQVTAIQPNNLKWTEEQLAGLHGENLANTAGATAEFYARDSVIDFKNESGLTGNFPNDAPFSEIGIPGESLSNEDNSALEVLTFLSFPETGFYTLGVNSDDGFRVSTAANARDRLGLVVGELDGDRLAADSIFRIYVPHAGYYPFRLIWENGQGAASLEWFSVLPDGSKALINDTGVGGSIPAFRSGPTPAYVSNVSPVPGEKEVRPDTEIKVNITDGTTTVDAGTVKLGLNGPAGTPTSATKNGGIITASLKPAGNLPAGSTNNVALVYADNAGKLTTNHWTFIVAEDTGAIVLVTPIAITQKVGDTLGGFPVVNLINNSGFSTPPDASNYGTTAHIAAGNTWVTATSVGPNYFTAGKPAPQFDLTLGGAFSLTHLVVWGYGGNNNEASDFTVEFSTDSGATFTGTETVQTSTLLGGNSEALVFSTAHLANAVRVTMINNAGGRGFAGAGTGDRAGLGEIKLLGRAATLITPGSITQKIGDTLGGFPVVNLINNSGFSTPPDANNYRTTAHIAAGNTWVTATSVGPNYFRAGRPAPQFELTLGGLFDLSHLVVWGYGGNNNEASDFIVEFSTDAGVTYENAETVQTTSLLGGNSEALPFATSHLANAIRITMRENAGGRGFAGAGTGDRVGLGEIKLLGTVAITVPPARPTLKVERANNSLTLSWPQSVSGFTLESSDLLPAVAWSPVPGVANNQVILPLAAGNRFFRLAKP